MSQRHEEALGIYNKAASYAPAFGMIGTLIGLINMLKGMDLDSGGASNLEKQRHHIAVCILPVSAAFRRLLSLLRHVATLFLLFFLFLRLLFFLVFCVKAKGIMWEN